MPKYLLNVTYTTDGIKGLVKDGGTKRAAAAKALVESLGGKIEVGSSRVDLQACKLEYSIVSPK